MNNMSVNQILNIWSKLDDAYYNENSFGGDTAELYVYMFMPYEPSVARIKDDRDFESGSMTAGWAKEAYLRASESMFELFSKFAKDREANITVDEKELGPWLKTSFNAYRVHVKVTPRKGR